MLKFTAIYEMVLGDSVCDEILSDLKIQEEIKTRDERMIEMSTLIHR